MLQIFLNINSSPVTFHPLGYYFLTLFIPLDVRHSLKTSENLCFSDVFKGYRMSGMKLSFLKYSFHDSEHPKNLLYGIHENYVVEVGILITEQSQEDCSW